MIYALVFACTFLRNQFDEDLFRRHCSNVLCCCRQVETTGDEYMVVSGAPVICKHHAQSICNMALDMRDGVRVIENPASGQPIQIRIGG